MFKKALLFIISFLTWSALNWPLDTGHAVFGVLAAFFVTYVLKDLYGERVAPFLEPRRYLVFIFWYLPLFFLGMVRAGLSVAGRILHPSPAVQPGIVRVRTTLTTDVGLTFLANTITLTSNTLTVDVDRESGVLYVHWVHVQTQDIESATKTIIGRFEPIVKKIFE
jgi:multicomponent Na+:H+ antiporter subunit E